MYHSLKKLVLAIVPKSFLIKNEPLLRSIFAKRYAGSNHSCTICGKGLKKFIPIAPNDLLCPFCGSRSRTRRLFELLKSNTLLHGEVLHFSPSRSLYRLLKKNASITYISTDFEDEFIADHKYDITNIDCEDNRFDLIICYHILEHIENDQKAMQELFRVLKPGGTCLVQTPFQEGDSIYEDDTITSKAGRLKAFGQEDHVRVYSVSGLVARLKNNGFNTINVISYDEHLPNGLKPETVLFLKKQLS